MKEEQIKAQYGNRSPFKVPEGYFEDLQNRIMSQIPEKEVVMNPHRTKKTWMYAAAIFCILLACGSLISKFAYPEAPAAITEMAKTDMVVQDSTTYIQDMVDYALISDAMIYYEYISDEEE